jgi:hypothetical protein
MTVYAKIENDKLITAYNGYKGITGLAANPELCLANGFTAYTEEEISGYFSNSHQIIDGVLTDIRETTDYINEQKDKSKKEIQEKYKNIMNEYVCAKVKRDLFETEEYQSMITDMYNEIGAL